MELGIGYFLIIFAAIGLAWVGYKVATHFKDERAPSDEERTKQLIQAAKIFYPDLRLTDTLDKLFELTYKDLVEAKQRGQDVQHYIRDQRLIVNERLRIWREDAERRQVEVERDSNFKVIEKNPPSDHVVRAGPRIHPILRR
jgi:hypothetical protein